MSGACFQTARPVPVYTETGPSGTGTRRSKAGRVIRAVRVEGIPDGQIANLAMARYRTIVIHASGPAAVRPVEPAGAAAVRTSVRHRRSLLGRSGPS